MRLLLESWFIRKHSTINREMGHLDTVCCLFWLLYYYCAFFLWLPNLTPSFTGMHLHSTCYILVLYTVDFTGIHLLSTVLLKYHCLLFLYTPLKHLNCDYCTCMLNSFYVYMYMVHVHIHVDWFICYTSFFQFIALGTFKGTVKLLDHNGTFLIDREYRLVSSIFVLPLYASCTCRCIVL